MNPHSRIPTSLVVAAAACFAALAVLVPGAPGASSPSDSGTCSLPAWIDLVTGHWGGDGCR
jgi:hypothetical protein